MKTLKIINACILMALPFFVSSQTIVNSAHDLSSTSSANITSNSESEICIFCHIPHVSSLSGPLWNRSDPAGPYTLYTSTTMDGAPGQPDGSSVLCLSCHDGTIALGNVISRATDIDFAPITTMPIGNTNLTTDLSDDHMISFVYNAALATADGQLKTPAAITAPVALENTKVQCISCHDSHSSLLNSLLLTTNENSALCMSCHDRDYWTLSTHKTSTAVWNGTGTDPWPDSTYFTVAKNACENCHNPHNAGATRLLNYVAEENNCIYCHNANVAGTDIVTELAKTYTHSVSTYNATHDPTEPNEVVTKHVECVDCHNPHASNADSAVAPNVNGFLRGVRGVNTNRVDVDPAAYEYEICYRCHAYTVDKPASTITRLNDGDNLGNVMIEFDLSNPAYHPVEGAGKNSDVPSLIAPLTVTSIIYCTDCHASNGTAPAGPHGSIYSPILKFNYTTTDFTTESYAAYELCYQCHNRATIIATTPMKFNKKVHNKHIVGQNAPCSACHDAHGNATAGYSKMINFDLSIVNPNDSGNLFWNDQAGSWTGECALKCHGKNHDTKTYSGPA